MAGLNFAHWRADDVRLRTFSNAIETHPSQALRTITSRLSGEGKKAILDLGKASKANIEFFSQTPCRIVIEDFFGDYRSLKPNAENNEIADFIRSIEARYRDKFDIILAWDLLNYLSAQEISVLARTLSSVAKPGTLLLAFLSSLTEIPELPRNYKISGTDTLTEETLGGSPARCERLSQREVLKLFPGWSMHRSLHMRNGMQEHLLIFQP